MNLKQQKDSARPLGSLIPLSIERIRHFEPSLGYYVAFSGGKDSTVLLDLVRKSGVRHDTHFNVTTVDPPELVSFIRTNYPEVIFDRPDMTMRQLIVHHGAPPTRTNRYCCRALKERGGLGRLVLTGIRWEESRGRSQRRMVESCRRNGSKTFLHPLIEWSSEQVWEYIRGSGLEYCTLYDEGRGRVGCVMCPLAGKKTMLAEAERWPKLARMYRHACDDAYAVHVGRHPGRQPYWRDAEDMYRWWLGMPAESASSGNSADSQSE